MTGFSPAFRPVEFQDCQSSAQCYIQPTQNSGPEAAVLAAMPNDIAESSSGDDLLKNSTLYKEFQAEREEILKHKWIESEKAGFDIGFERALTDWIIKHRSKWRKGRQTTQHQH